MSHNSPGNIVRYRVSRYHASSYITEERFVSQTAQFYVRANGSKHAKDGQDHAYFATWKEARDHALSVAERELQNAQNTVNAIRALSPGALLGGG